MPHQREKVFICFLYGSEGDLSYKIMVDKAFQGKGIAKAATALMIAEMAAIKSMD
ncbi:GNAT superfamily N-acetyltransferase [Brevibacillus sp. 1238]|nr:GNAT superfamily N-acetyltransferase [Brevibacillus sp. 1238]